MQIEESMQPLRPYERTDTLKQFLDHDRHVLRFNCYWDDSVSMFGDTREMVSWLSYRAVDIFLLLVTSVTRLVTRGLHLFFSLCFGRNKDYGYP